MQLGWNSTLSCRSEIQPLHRRVARRQQRSHKRYLLGSDGWKHWGLVEVLRYKKRPVNGLASPFTHLPALKKQTRTYYPTYTQTPHRHLQTPAGCSMAKPQKLQFDTQGGSQREQSNNIASHVLHLLLQLDQRCPAVKRPRHVPLQKHSPRVEEADVVCSVPVTVEEPTATWAVE